MACLYKLGQMFSLASVPIESAELQVLVHGLLRFVVVGLAAGAVDGAGRASC
jgi:hypothetical protein